MQASVLVSVLVPLYNHAQYIEKALDSLLAQEHIALEIIVVDDGSSDGGDQCVEEKYVPQGVKLLRQKRNGCGTTRALRKAVSAAQGKYICWLSSDDWFLPNKVHAQYLAYQNTFGETEGVLHSWPGYVSYDLNHALTSAPFTPDEIHRQFEQHGFVRWHEETTDPPEDLQLFYFFMFNYINGITIFMPRRLFEVHGGFSEAFPLTQDYEFWFRLAWKDINFRVMPQALSYSRMHAGNLENYRHDIPAESAVIVRLYAALASPQQWEAARVQQGFDDPLLLLARLMQYRSIPDLELFYLKQARESQKENRLEPVWEDRYQLLYKQFGPLDLPTEASTETLCIGMYLSESTLPTPRWYMCLTHFFQAFTAQDPVKLVLYIAPHSNIDHIQSALEKAMTQIETYLTFIPDLDIELLEAPELSDFLCNIHVLLPVAAPDTGEQKMLYHARSNNKPMLYHAVPHLLRACLNHKDQLPSDYRELLTRCAPEEYGQSSG